MKTSQVSAGVVFLLVKILGILLVLLIFFFIISHLYGGIKENFKAIFGRHLSPLITEGGITYREDLDIIAKSFMDTLSLNIKPEESIDFLCKECCGFPGKVIQCPLSCRLGYGLTSLIPDSLNGVVVIDNKNNKIILYSKTGNILYSSGIKYKYFPIYVKSSDFYQKNFCGRGERKKHLFNYIIIAVNIGEIPKSLLEKYKDNSIILYAENQNFFSTIDDTIDGLNVFIYTDKKCNKLIKPFHEKKYKYNGIEYKYIQDLCSYYRSSGDYTIFKCNSRKMLYINEMKSCIGIP